MVSVQGTLSYIYRGKEFTWDFYALQSIERLGVRVTGEKLRSEIGYRFILSIEPSEEIELRQISLEMPIELGEEDRIFVNGFQSWTESREFAQHEKISCLAWPARLLLWPYGDYSLYRYPGKPGRFHGWTYSYIGQGGSIELFASLSERDGYTLFEYDCPQKTLRISRDCSGLRIKEPYSGLDFVCLSGAPDDVFDAYFRAYYDVQGLTPTIAPPLTGWTSWNNHSTGVSMEVVEKNLESFTNAGAPIDLLQVDNGWQAAVGDWTEAKSKFPDGMAAVVRAVKSMPGSTKAGIWLAPFVCEKKSEVFRNHRDWVLKDKRGKLVRAGLNSNWSGFFYALDFQNEGLKEHLRSVFKTIFTEWGFDFVKLDFLYAAALKPTHEKTHGQLMVEAMEFLREVCGDKLILGSGVPLGPAFGLVDYCRVGSDVGLQWEDNALRFAGYRERMSAQNSLLSVIGRRHLNGRAFVNDPDVFILRTSNQSMTQDQRMTLFRINLALGGVLLTSDDPAEYDESELSAYLSVFPFAEKKVKGIEMHGNTYLLRLSSEDGDSALIANLSEEPQTLLIQPGTYETGSAGGIGPDGRLTLRPFETRAVR